MNSGQRNEMLGEMGRRDPPRLSCSHRSAEILLVFLILLSLNIVAAYDWFLTRILKLGRSVPTNRTDSFETTHICKSFGRRVRSSD